MEFKSQICTTIEQSKRLLELGLKKETADMVYQAIGVTPFNKWKEHKIQEDFFPAWSLHRLLSIMPTTFKYYNEEYGEEVGLDKPWKPDWKDSSQQKYTIFYYQDEITSSKGPNVNRFLSFPTEEMRDFFLENFKELIEQCKDLL